MNYEKNSSTSIWICYQTISRPNHVFHILEVGYWK